VVEGLAKYLNRCQHIVTPSDSIKQDLAEYAGLTDRITTIPTGIDLAPYQKADGQAIRQQFGWNSQKVLISVGRLAEEKNIKTLLSAVAQVMSQRADVRLLLVGDGPQRKELEKFSQELGMAAKVNFTGRIPFDQVPAYLKAADLFCFASITETQGLVTMEAMAAGLPVAAVAATGTSDGVEHGQQGLLTENDSQALSQAIQQILDDGSLYARLKAGVAAKAKAFDMLEQARKMVAVYEQAMADKKANRTIRVDVAQLKAKFKERYE
jgi:glycosyltransferase involved in cell wall biosynthesis